ncbi:MAG: transposase, partial [bacterium]|nr:transposase [bacterium]
MNAFLFFGGTPQRLVVDNMLTAVTERVGPVIRFNDAFLDFSRIFKISPHACNVRAAHEKGKVESTIKLVRYNFWPLRSFSNLRDVRAQSRNWLNRIANARIHQTTGERPFKRFEKDRLNPLPEVLPDFRETKDLLVYKDFAVRFDANTYTVPPRTIGGRVILKAGRHKVSIYDRTRRIAIHDRSYSKRERIELPSHVEQVKKLQNKLWRDRHVASFISIGEDAVDYLRELADAGQPIK